MKQLLTLSGRSASLALMMLLATSASLRPLAAANFAPISGSLNVRADNHAARSTPADWGAPSLSDTALPSSFASSTPTMVAVAGSGGVSAQRSEVEGQYGAAWAQNIWRDMLG